MLAKDWTIGSLRFDPWKGQRIFPIAFVSRPGLGPTQPYQQWVPEVHSLGLKSGQCITLTTYPHLVPKSWIRSYTFSPPNAFKHESDGFTFTSQLPVIGNTSGCRSNTYSHIRPTRDMYLGLIRGTTRVYTTYGLCSTPWLAHRCSQKDGPNLHSLSMRRNTQVESHNKTVGQQHGRSKQPCWWDSSFINLTGLKN
jgi:hypothetical protein